MNQLPERIEISSEIVLEKIGPIHSAMMFEQVDRHRDYLSDFVDWTRFNLRLADTQQFIQRCEQEAEQGLSYTWAICVAGQAMGTLSFNKPIDWQQRTVALGYWLSPEVQGQGIVTQAVNRVIEETQLHFERYILRCAVHNQCSNAVAKRCGFEFVETKHAAEKIGAQYYDQHYYTKTILR